MLKLFLWLRYLHKKKIVSLSIVAVALSAALLIVVASLFNGFINAFEASAVETMGDVVILPPRGFSQAKFANYPLLLEKLDNSSVVEAASATLSGQGLLFLGKGNVRAVRVLGIDPESRSRVTDFKNSLLKQSSEPNEPSFKTPDGKKGIAGYIGIGVIGPPNEETDEYDFDQINNFIGKTVTLTTGSVTVEKGPDGEKNQVKRQVLPFTVTDIVFTGVYELDKAFIYLPIDKLQEKLYPASPLPLADQIQIKLVPGSDTMASLAQIRGIWEDFATRNLNWTEIAINDTQIMTSQEAQAQYVTELYKQRDMLIAIFSIISLSVILLVSCILYMIVITKQKDIAIIKSCGATSSSVTFIFVGFGGCVGAAGAAIGLLIAYIVTRNINTIEQWIRVAFGLKLWKSSAYMFSKIPNAMDWDWALIFVVCSILAAAIGAMIPAFVAAKTKPVIILRYE